MGKEDPSQIQSDVALSAPHYYQADAVRTRRAISVYNHNVFFSERLVRPLKHQDSEPGLLDRFPCLRLALRANY